MMQFFRSTRTGNTKRTRSLPVPRQPLPDMEVVGITATSVLKIQQILRTAPAYIAQSDLDETSDNFDKIIVLIDWYLSREIVKQVRVIEPKLDNPL
jgi:hypothetical protein